MVDALQPFFAPHGPTYTGLQMQESKRNKSGIGEPSRDGFNRIRGLELPKEVANTE